jgi:DNA-directed RNA polymerase subunit RPC12/RpoP
MKIGWKEWYQSGSGQRAFVIAVILNSCFWIAGFVYCITGIISWKTAIILLAFTSVSGVLNVMQRKKGSRKCYNCGAIINQSEYVHCPKCGWVCPACGERIIVE